MPPATDLASSRACATAFAHRSRQSKFVTAALRPGWPGNECSVVQIIRGWGRRAQPRLGTAWERDKSWARAGGLSTQQQCAACTTQTGDMARSESKCTGMSSAGRAGKQSSVGKQRGMAAHDATQRAQLLLRHRRTLCSWRRLEPRCPHTDGSSCGGYTMPACCWWWCCCMTGIPAEPTVLWLAHCAAIAACSC